MVNIYYWGFFFNFVKKIAEQHQEYICIMLLLNAKELWWYSLSAGQIDSVLVWKEQEPLLCC